MFGLGLENLGTQGKTHFLLNNSVLEFNRITELPLVTENKEGTGVQKKEKRKRKKRGPRGCLPLRRRYKHAKRKTHGLAITG